MREVNVHKAKTHFSKLLREVEAGTEIVILRAASRSRDWCRCAPARPASSAPIATSSWCRTTSRRDPAARHACAGAVRHRAGASLALVTGRRRVGKTYLLARSWPAESTFLFTAARTTTTQNRRQLILDLATWTGEAIEPDDYPTWRSVFDLVWRTRPGTPLAVVLDEFQYLTTDGRLCQMVDAAILQEEGLSDAAAYTAIVRAIANGRVTRSRIADATGLGADPSLVRRLDRLTPLGPVGITPIEEAPRNAPVRYHLVEPPLRFHHAFVTPHASLLERGDPREVMRAVVAPRLDTFLGPAFERLAAPTYDRLRSSVGWPMVERWSRWQITDRLRRPLEVGLVAPWWAVVP